LEMVTINRHLRTGETISGRRICSLTLGECSHIQTSEQKRPCTTYIYLSGFSLELSRGARSGCSSMQTVHGSSVGPLASRMGQSLTVFLMSLYNPAQIRYWISIGCSVYGQLSARMYRLLVPCFNSLLHLGHGLDHSEISAH
jgi:hypothetical protein